MQAVFWVKRYLLAALPLFAILAAVEWLKGSQTSMDYISAGVWSAIAAAIFTGAAWRRHKSQAACALCDDITKASKPKA